MVTAARRTLWLSYSNSKDWLKEIWLIIISCSTVGHSCIARSIPQNSQITRQATGDLQGYAKINKKNNDDVITVSQSWVRLRILCFAEQGTLFIQVFFAENAEEMRKSAVKLWWFYNTTQDMLSKFASEFKFSPGISRLNLSLSLDMRFLRLTLGLLSP